MMKTQKRVVAIIALLAIAGLVKLPSANAATATYGVNLQTDVQEVITLDCGGATVNLGNLTPGTPVTGSSVCTGTTNANGGYNLAVRRDDASDTTMDKVSDATTNIADKTAWDPTANTGAGNAATWAGTGLGFTVFASTADKNTTWWGTGTTVTDANNLYAGFASTQTDIMRYTSYNGAPTTTSVGYKLDVPATQRSGAYDGSITYQATTTP
ncbi:MAG: hypothetical protein WC798_04015 [Candidatus Paceibacterota bacterium]|jgi:hypothetical protein